MEEAKASRAKSLGDVLPREGDLRYQHGEPQATIGGAAVETTSLVARETRLQQATDQLVPATPAASTERSTDALVPQHFSLVSPPQLQPSPRQSPRAIAPGEETHVDEEIAMQAALGKAFQRGVDGLQRNHLAAVSAFDAESPGFGRSRDPSPSALSRVSTAVTNGVIDTTVTTGVAIAIVGGLATTWYPAILHVQMGYPYLQAPQRRSEE